MTGRVPLRDLKPGDEILDLIVSGTVADSGPLPRPAGAYRVDLVEGGFFIAPGSHEVITNREPVDA